MSSDLPSQPGPEMSDDEVEHLTFRVLRHEGKFVPQSPEEVADDEKESPDAPLPESLREPLALLKEPTPELAIPSSLLTDAGNLNREKSMFRRRRKWLIGTLVPLLLAVPLFHVGSWSMNSLRARRAHAQLQERRDELARQELEQRTLTQAARKELGLDAAEASEIKLKELQSQAFEKAKKNIEEKEFAVRMTGPAHIQPGAPNLWQIETLRHGMVRRPKKLELVVKDGANQELFRQTHEKPVGAAMLSLPVSIWNRTKSGSDLFLEVITQSDNGSTLSEQLPLSRPLWISHLVTDKPLYKPGEVLRYRSLTLDRSTLQPPQTELHLRFQLRTPSGTVEELGEGNGRVLRDFEPILGPDDKPLRGLGAGEYAIPVTAPGGEYQLELSEVDERNKWKLLEVRKFIVNRYVPDTFEKKLEFDGKSYGPGEFVQARLDVSRTAGGPMKEAFADLLVQSNGKSVYSQSQAKLKTVSAPDGGIKTVLDIRFQLPAALFESAGIPSATLSVRIQDGGDIETIIRPIPLVTKNLRIDFFPEGGDLVEGVPGRVYFMVRTPEGKPADVKGNITDGTQTLTEAATLTDAENPGVNRGQGVFTFTPQRGKNYFLKLTSPFGITEPTKEGFPLPAAKSEGVGLTTLESITPQGGAIRVTLQSPTGPRTMHVGAYVRERLIAQEKIVLAPNRPTEISLKGDEAAGGVTRITVFEEVKGDDGKETLIPRAERLTFRRCPASLKVTATPDKARYTPSERVRLDLAATTETGQPARGILMVGVVNRSVITMADNKTDRLAPTHFFLASEVKNSADLEHADFLLSEHPRAAQALDLLLGTQGWRRFAEQEIPPALDDKPHVDEMLVVHGQRAFAPVDALKLEQQKLNSDFAPKVEVARLRTASLENQWKRRPLPMSQEIAATQSAIETATDELDGANRALRKSKEIFEEIYAPLLIGLLVLTMLFFFGVLAWDVLRTLFDGVKEPGNPSRALSTLVMAAFIAIVIIAAITSVGSNANSTFSSVGFAIKPAAAAGGGNGVPLREASSWIRREDRTQEIPTEKSTSAPEEKRKIPGWSRAVPGISPLPKNQQVSLTDSDSVKLRDAFTPLRERHRKQNDMPSAIPPSVVREYAHERDASLGEVRADFTETVYWHPVLVLPESGKSTVEFQLSDDIARYQVLVAGHTLDGRIGSFVTTIEARKPFSADPKLPLEISHTDTVTVPVRVTNDSPVRRNVALAATTTGLKTSGALEQSLDLEPNAKGRVLVQLRADKLEGAAGVLIEGVSGVEKDAIARTIRITPDGFPGSGSVSDVLEKGVARGTITLPKDVVPGSLRMRLEMYPTSLADLVKGLDGLLHEPYGCFEQTSTTNYPNTLILDYLNQTNQASPEVAARAKSLLDRGYARLVSFECPDTPLKIRQGYEWFGAADRPHLALTAYGLLQFKDMARVQQVDPVMIKRTQKFLLSQRDGKGGFRESDRSHSFGSAPQHVVNAYVLWALVESDPEDTEQLDLKSELTKLRTEALDATTESGKDPYVLALAGNIFQLRNDRETSNKLLDRLKEKHFKNGVVQGAVTSITYSSGRTLEMETTALTVLGWLRASDPAYAIAIKEATRWLTQQRGGYGAYGSTQSTILVLKALGLYARKNAHPAESGTLRLLVNGKEIVTRMFTAEETNVIGVDVPRVDESFPLNESNKVEITCDSQHQYPISLSYTYTTLTPPSDPNCAVGIRTSLKQAEATEGDTVPLHVELENRFDQGQGMTVAIVGIPAGMKPPTDMKQLTDLREKGVIDFFELRDRELVLYWRHLAPKQKTTVAVDLICEIPGSYRGPASRGYLYYGSDHKQWVSPLSINIAPAAFKP